ncbi:MAG TPA: sigma 54-interacting transcriptional regulator [Bryobacteraceae bacterium]|nr:sigma 54-interacting transcriptional regulator [Bryobacteraceae bacterium]
MTAQIIVLNGPLSGTRFDLTSGDTDMGRSPTAAIHLPEPAAAWRHCIVHCGEDGLRLRDLNTAGGTYVNGMRVEVHELEDGDQISIGDTVLAFRAAPIALDIPISPRVTLLRACTLLFLFRGLATSASDAQSDLLEAHVRSLIAELAPGEEIGAVIASSEDDLRQVISERESEATALPTSAERPAALRSGLHRLLVRSMAEGPVIDQERNTVAVPVYAAGVPRGLIAARFRSEHSAELDDHLEVLSAISTLAAVALENVREVQALRSENARLQERLTADTLGVVGKSAAMLRILHLVERVAAQDTTVLILGESGTGKELIARALHQGSPRRHKPFMAINCAALTETLLESELFGHEKGAFTGAVAQKKGKLEVAEGGTVFLDEIGELAPALQAKLLRVLQQREFERVGGTRTMPLDVRIVAATNRDLSTEVKRGGFREDLFHRLNVVALRMPPLRERPEDIPLLAEHFLRKSAVRMGRVMAGITPEAERLLIRYRWPGNVRELENAMERGVVLSDTEWLTDEDLPESLTGSVPELPVIAQPGSYTTMMGDARRDAVLRAWEEAGGDYKQAAALLGIHPNSLLRLIRKHGLRDTLRRGVASA